MSNEGGNHHASSDESVESEDGEQERQEGVFTKSRPDPSKGNCEDEETETSQNVPLWTIDLWSFEVLSDHGDEMDGNESTNETTEMMPPLPPDSWFKRTETFCGKFRKLCSEDHQDEEDPCPDC